MFGRYAIEKPLGQGGMGTVLRARDTVLERTVALKIMRPEHATKQSSIARFFREAKVAAQLTHPNVVRVYDLGEVEGTAFIAMEYVPGQSLRAYLGDGTTPASTKLRWMTEVARALSAAHARGLLHRDVKPENILISTEGVAKLADFGLAKRQEVTADMRASFHTQVGFIVGTPGYMAPEQLRRAEVDARTDQFGWAITAYTVLTGQHPRARDPQLVRPITPLHELCPDVPLRAAEAIMRALSLDRSRRFRDMDELLAELEPTIGSRPSLTPPSPTGPPPPMRGSRQMADEEALGCASRMRMLLRSRREMARLMDGPPTAPPFANDVPADQETLAESWWFAMTVTPCPAAPLERAAFSPDGSRIVAVGAGGIAAYEDGAWRIVATHADPDGPRCVAALEDGSVAIGGREGLAVRVASDGSVQPWMLEGVTPSEQRGITFHAVDALPGAGADLVFAGEHAGRVVAAFAVGMQAAVTIGHAGSIYHVAYGPLVVGSGTAGIEVLTRSGIEVMVDEGPVSMCLTHLDDDTVAIGGVDATVSVITPSTSRYLVERVETTAAIVAVAGADRREAWAVDANCGLFRRARLGRWIPWVRAPRTKAQPIAAWACAGKLVVVDANGVVLEGNRG